jgi:hypothetical protein
VVKLRPPFGGLEVALFIDRATKLISKMTYTEGRNTQVDLFADYREVGGLKISHKRQSSGGRGSTLEIKSVELDPKVDPKLFDRPMSAPAAAPAAPPSGKAEPPKAGPPAPAPPKAEPKK